MGFVEDHHAVTKIGVQAQHHDHGFGRRDAVAQHLNQQVANKVPFLWQPFATDPIGVDCP
jgi:hypothetical protein